jgi:hypothetical protein
MKSEPQRFPVGLTRGLLLIIALSAGALLFGNARADAPGGFIETPDTAKARPHLTQEQAKAFLPARGKFTFPAPYNTQAIRLTSPDDCVGGGDCVYSVGYSYWRNMNNSAGSNIMYIFLGTNWSQGGSGPMLLSYDKTTDEVKNLGPLFPASDPLSKASGEGWYFSATMPTALYLNDGPRMVRYDVLSHQSQTIYDVSQRFGAAYDIWQMHSSNDDKVHSATLREKATGNYLGCVVYHEDTAKYQYFPKDGTLDECNLDRSGRWLMMLGTTPGGGPDDDMRIIDLASGANTLSDGTDPISGAGLTTPADLVKAGIERRVLDKDGAVGHADMGYGYVLGADNWGNYPNSIQVWDFNQNPLSGKLVFHDNDRAAPASNHISHLNARPGVPIDQQFACGSSASATTATWANEIVCYRLDGSFKTLVVAPVMTDLSGLGSDTYGKEPKGNLDITGQYFIWTSTAAGRMDAYLVKVPTQQLTANPAATTPGTSSAIGAGSGGGSGGGGSVDPLLLITAAAVAGLAFLRRYQIGSFLRKSRKTRAEKGE